MNDIMNKIKQLLNKMTLTEKIGQLTLASFNRRTEEEASKGLIGAVINANCRDEINRLQAAAAASRLKIPLLVGADVIHGFKTIFPVPLAEACSFNLDLIEKTARYSTQEAVAIGINWIYAPILDVTNDPRWGRINESSGEDPFLVGAITKRRIHGIQEDGKVAACCKHYIGYGKVEAGVDYFPTDYSEHTLRTYFLPPYKKAVAAGVLSIMSAFTTYNGIPITASRYLLNDILRRELGFEGVLVTDWDCLKHLFDYRFAAGAEAATLGIRRTIDVDMHSRIYQKYLPEAIKCDPKLIPYIDAAVRRVLELKEKLGLFASKRSFYRIDRNETTQKHAERSALESLILFKNKNKILPLAPQTKLLVVGPFNNDGDIHLGAWSALGKPDKTVTIKTGIKTYFPESSFFDTPEDIRKTDFISLKQKAQAADTVLLNLGEPRYLSGENNNRADIDLPNYQDLLVDFLVAEKIPFIAYVTAGRPLVIVKIAAEAEALLWSFHLGHMAGIALAKILAGIENPSAKTVVTFPRALGQIPIYYNRLPCGRPDLIRYLDEELTPLYPFGYGLSYSEFIYRRIKVDYDKTKQTVIVEGIIENVSAIPGKETIQVYLLPRKTNELRPMISLIGFKKVTLAKLQSIHFHIECPITSVHYGTEIDIMVGSSSQSGKIINLRLT